MQYRIISVSTVWSQKKAIEKLTKEVNEAISLGWEPLGGVALIGTDVVQVMIKRR
jgi:hypothetical protein